MGRRERRWVTPRPPVGAAPGVPVRVFQCQRDLEVPLHVRRRSPIEGHGIVYILAPAQELHLPAEIGLHRVFDGWLGAEAHPLRQPPFIPHLLGGAAEESIERLPELVDLDCPLV